VPRFQTLFWYQYTSLTLRERAIKANQFSAGFRVPAGSASSPSAKRLYRLTAPLRWWRRSILRILLEECRNFPLRILAILRTPSLREGVPIPLDPSGDGLASFRLKNSFPLACTQSMLDLQNQNAWIGVLESQICCQAFQRGALFERRKSSNESGKAVQHQS
jgi:hypothetical protein